MKKNEQHVKSFVEVALVFSFAVAFSHFYGCGGEFGDYETTHYASEDLGDGQGGYTLNSGVSTGWNISHWILSSLRPRMC